MFVKTTRRRRGDKVYEYLSLVESVRDGAKVGHRTLLRLGEVTALRESGQLERIVAALEAHLRRERVDVGAVAAEGAPAVGAVAAAATVWGRLGLDGWFAQVGAGRGAGALEHAVFAMAANRLVAPCSKRRLAEWAAEDVVMPEGWEAPSLDQYWWALDAVADAKEATEAHLYSRLCDLSNLDLRLVCYDLTSTFFEGSPRPSGRFPSRAFGYSRDHRGDRPQIVIGLLCTSEGIPIAHHVFAGNTNDASTLPAVLDDLAARFAVGRICVVADRGLISKDNVDAVADAGFDHLLATRLHRDHIAKEALEAVDDDTAWSRYPSTAAGPQTSRSQTAPAPWSRHPTPAPAETTPAEPNSSPAPRPNCSPWSNGSEQAGSKTPPKSQEPPSASSAPAAPGGSSTSRSDPAGSYTTTTKTPTHMNSSSRAATCSPPASAPPKPPQPKSWPPTASSQPSKQGSGPSRTSCTCDPCGTGPNKESEATSPCASTPPSSRPSSAVTSPKPTSATPTSITST